MFPIDDNVADPSFETHNRETLAAEQTNTATVSGSYRGVSPRDRRANSLPILRRHVRFSPVVTMRANSFSSFPGSNTSNDFIDPASIPLPVDNANELAHHPVPRGTPDLPAELEPNTDSRPAVPPRNPSRAARPFSNGMRENLDRAQEGQHVMSFMGGFSGDIDI